MGIQIALSPAGGLTPWAPKPKSETGAPQGRRPTKRDLEELQRMRGKADAGGIFGACVDLYSGAAPKAQVQGLWTPAILWLTGLRSNCAGGVRQLGPGADVGGG
jgi:hypothetical protein